MEHPPIEAQGLRKVYSSRFGSRKITALEDVSFRVDPGQVFGLLGPNGAGKTTAVKILLGLTRPTGGSASLCGRAASDPESRRRVGYLPEGHRFPGYLTAWQTLSIFGRMSGVDPATLRRRGPELLERVRLSAWSDVRVKKFSKGMTQRLGLAAALIHDPDVLLLDEPTDGVDPVGRREIRDLLQEEAARGKAILLNSHLLSEIERICSRVAVLRAGRVVAEGAIEDLTASGAGYRLVATGADDRLVMSLRAAGASVVRAEEQIEVAGRDIEHLNALVDLLRSGGAMLQEISPVRASLEDVFVGLIREGVTPEASRRRVA